MDERVGANVLIAGRRVNYAFDVINLPLSAEGKGLILLKL